MGSSRALSEDSLFQEPPGTMDHFDAFSTFLRIRSCHVKSFRRNNKCHVDRLLSIFPIRNQNRMSVGPSFRGHCSALRRHLHTIHWHKGDGTIAQRLQIQALCAASRKQCSPETFFPRTHQRWIKLVLTKLLLINLGFRSSYFLVGTYFCFS